MMARCEKESSSQLGMKEKRIGKARAEKVWFMSRMVPRLDFGRWRRMRWMISGGRVSMLEYCGYPIDRGW